MGVEQIQRLEAFASAFGVEVQTAGGESAVLENYEHHLGRQIDVRWELVGIPAEKHVAVVGIDRTEHTLRTGVIQFVFNGMTSQSRVVGFDVHLDVVFQTVGAEEVNARGRIKVVLMLGRFLRFGFKVELTLESDFLGVINRHVHEDCQMIQLALHVGVEPGHVSFSTAPEHVAFSAQFFGNFNSLFNLSGCVSEGISMAGSCCAMHESGIAEQIRRTPKELFAGTSHFVFEDLDDFVQIGVGFLERVAFRSNVAIMEAEIRHLQLFQHFKEDGNAFLSVRDAIAAIVPRHVHRRGAKRVRTIGSHTVPEGSAEPQMIFHRFAFDEFVWIIIAERQIVVRIGSFVLNFFYFGKIGHERCTPCFGDQGNRLKSYQR